VRLPPIINHQSSIINHQSSIKHTATYYNDGDLPARGDW